MHGLFFPFHFSLLHPSLHWRMRRLIFIRNVKKKLATYGSIRLVWRSKVVRSSPRWAGGCGRKRDTRSKRGRGSRSSHDTFALASHWGKKQLEPRGTRGGVVVLDPRDICHQGGELLVRGPRESRRVRRCHLPSELHGRRGTLRPDSRAVLQTRTFS